MVVKWNTYHSSFHTLLRVWRLRNILLEVELFKIQIHENMKNYVSSQFVLVDQKQIYDLISVNTSQIK